MYDKGKIITGIIIGVVFLTLPLWYNLVLGKAKKPEPKILTKIIIEAGEIKTEAILAETETAKAIWDSLPIESTCNIWENEVYFDIPISLPLDETAKETVDVGDLGYCPTRKALCIFFGPIRPKSAVNIVGKIVADPKIFKKVSPDTEVYVKKGPEKCVEPKPYMRSNHMTLLNDWRNLVVREQKRVYIGLDEKEYDISLQNTCINCHSNKTKFCDECHNYAAVTPYCWTCHIQPKEEEKT